MGLLQWLLKRSRIGQRSTDMISFLDDTGTVVRIPASRLPPGGIQIQLQGSDSVVWTIPEGFQKSYLRHSEFEEDVRDYIRQIQAAFSEQRPLSLEEWEDGFRRDANPAREIAVWSHAAGIYMEFTANEPIAERRRDVYRCIIKCMVTTGPDAVWRVLQTNVLNRADAEKVINRFFGKQD